MIGHPEIPTRRFISVTILPADADPVDITEQVDSITETHIDDGIPVVVARYTKDPT